MLSGSPPGQTRPGQWPSHLRGTGWGTGWGTVPAGRVAGPSLGRWLCPVGSLPSAPGVTVSAWPGRWGDTGGPQVCVREPPRPRRLAFKVEIIKIVCTLMEHSSCPLCKVALPNISFYEWFMHHRTGRPVRSPLAPGSDSKMPARGPLRPPRASHKFAPGQARRRTQAGWSAGVGCLRPCLFL